MDFKLDGIAFENVPAITKWSFEDLDDDPAKHRWRAWWASSDGEVHGIELRAYPIIKVNPASVWINEDGCREATKQPWEDGAPDKRWVPFNPAWMKKRLCHNGAGAAWAKPTQEEALRSLAIRLTRWTARLRDDVQRAQSAATALEKLRPDFTAYVERARMNLTNGLTYKPSSESI